MLARPRVADPRLAPFVDRARIDCERLFETQCPQYWGALQPTADIAMRRCPACEQPVYLVTTEHELLRRAQQGECVAVILPAELPDPAVLPRDVPRLPVTAGSQPQEGEQRIDLGIPSRGDE